MPALIEAGLPNVWGSISKIKKIYWQNVVADGAFQLNDEKDKYGTSDEADTPCSGFNFDARRCSTVYGNSDTVQPPAIVLIPQIRF